MIAPDPIGETMAAHLLERCYWQCDPTETVGSALAATLGIALQAQYEEASDDFHAIAETLDVPEEHARVLFARLAEATRDALSRVRVCVNPDHGIATEPETLTVNGHGDSHDCWTVSL